MDTKEIEKPLSETDSNSEDVSASTNEEAKAQELMEMFSDPKVLKAYQNIRKDIYGVGERKKVSQKEKKKKKAKRRMAKKSKH
jgi:hypothetical protein